MLKWVLGILALIAAGIVIAGYVFVQRVEISDYPLPIRIDTEPEIPSSESVIVTSVRVPLAMIRRGLEDDVPRQLWSIDERRDNCVPRKEIKVFGQQLGRTPKVKCRITGSARRGAIQLRGRGDRLIARFPITATVVARDIGGVIKQETATATAMMEVQTRFSVAQNWQPRADVDLDYRWVREPGIDILGERITFTKPADRELTKVLAGVEKSLQRQIESQRIRSDVERLWSRGFSVASLSKENPPVWLTVAPTRIGIGGFQVAGKQLQADILLAAQTRVMVGEKPSKPAARPLGRNERIRAREGFAATVPVLADYAQLEPVVLRELRKLAARKIERKELGRIELTVESVEIYATESGRIAVGINATAEPVGNITGRVWGRSKGTVWLTGKPVTETGSTVVRIDDLAVYGDMDRVSGDVLIRVLDSADVRTAIQAALVEDFQADYGRIIEKVRAGLADVSADDGNFSFSVDAIEHGQVQVTGQGLYMPVEARGSVRTRLDLR
ncbi:DUF4403 family protein [Altererythrobacter sp.]|nr:DUF4403 family protein [Altererythrobacter sp.]